jgi:hypothetical protein
MKEADDVTNRITELFGQFTSKLVHQHGMPPEKVAKSAVAAALMLYLEHCQDDQRAAADWLRQFAQELDEGAPPAPQAN